MKSSCILEECSLSNIVFNEYSRAKDAKIYQVLGLYTGADPNTHQSGHRPNRIL